MRDVAGVLPTAGTSGRAVEGVLRPLVESFCTVGGVVLDPFAGSGSTLVAAALAGRGYVWYRAGGKYCQLARRRLAGVIASAQGA